MATLSTKCLVAKINCQANTYYVTSRDGISLDDIGYKNVVISWGDASLIGNFGENSQIGSMSITMVNGEFITDGGWEFDITDTWNNKICEVKLCDVETNTTFEECVPYYKGIIKDFSIDGGEISFSIDSYDNSDDLLLPAIVCEDQTTLTKAQHTANIEYLGQSAGQYIIKIVSSIFNIGEYVFLINPKGECEYNRILNIASNNYYMEIALQYSYDPIDDVKSTCSKAFINIPKESIGKSIPIQCGKLNGSYIDTLSYNNSFAKILNLNNKIGSQVLLADYKKLKSLSSVGIWNNDTKKYSSGNHHFDLDHPALDYEINSLNNGVNFRNVSVTTIDADIIYSTGVTAISVADRSKIQWVDESNNNTDTKLPQILSLNVISIGSELMLLVEKPVGTGSGNIYVERGYNNTTITTHSSGDPVYQNSKWSGRNLLSITERFDAKYISNLFYGEFEINQTNITAKSVTLFTNNQSTYNPSNLIKNTYSDINKAFVIDKNYTNISGKTGRFVNFDLIFSEITKSYPVYGWWVGVDFISERPLDSNLDAIQMCIFDPNSSPPSNYNDVLGTYSIYAVLSHWNGGVSFYNYFWSSHHRHASDYTLYGNWEDRNLLNRDSANSNFNEYNLTSLSDLNRKWKINITFNHHSSGVVSTKISMTLKAFGFWIDYFINFTQEKMCAELQGRIYDSIVVSVCGNGTAGNLIENPVDMLCHLLIQELKKETTSFETTNWQTISTFYKTVANFNTAAQPSFPVPKIAFSYGISDERKKGYEFCEWIASHFNLAIPRNTSGKIDIVNLWKNQNNPDAAKNINIEDILQVPGGNRRISIKQTGVDLLYNDVIIKYNRNNSTDEYQSIYIVPDNLVLISPLDGSPNTVLQAREYFYNGKKRTLEIESPFIYNEYDAIRKAHWEINDKAEAKFWIEMYIDYELYDNKSLTEQYKIGDVITLTGKCNGILFDTNRKFIIQDTVNCDAGRELKINMKSNDPVTAFAFMSMNTDNEIIQDSIDDSLPTWQNSIDDSLDTIQDVV